MDDHDDNAKLLQCSLCNADTKRADSMTKIVCPTPGEGEEEKNCKFLASYQTNNLSKLRELQAWGPAYMLLSSLQNRMQAFCKLMDACFYHLKFNLHKPSGSPVKPWGIQWKIE